MLVMQKVKRQKLKLSKARHWQAQKMQKWKIWQKQKICKTILDGIGPMTETPIWISWKEASVAEKLSTAGTLFIPRLSLEFHLKVWNKDYSYMNASPDEVKEVRNIHAQDK